jgi:hypothetical protein
MGAGLRTSRGNSKGKYFKFFDGNFTREFYNKKPKGISAEEERHLLDRTTSKGNVIYYIPYETLQGHIVEGIIENNEKINQLQLKLVFSDGEQEMTFFDNADYRRAKSFYKRVPNIDFSKPVLLRAYKFTPDDKDKPIQGYSVHQGDNFTEKIEPHYTRETPNGLPKPTHNQIKDTWNFDEQDEFLMNVFNEKMEEVVEMNSDKRVANYMDNEGYSEETKKFAAGDVAEDDVPTAPPSAPQPSNDGPDDDDLPF